MKQLICILLVLLFVLIFPLNMLQLPDDIVLSVKKEMRGFITDHFEDDNNQNESADNINVGKIKMGMTPKQVVQLIGAPQDKLLNEYHHYWTVFHHDYNDFMLVMFVNNKACGVYSNQDMIIAPKGIRYGMARKTVEKKLGQPLKIFAGRDYNLTLDNQESGTYLINGYYLTFYYDKFRGDTVRGIKLIEQSIDLDKPQHYPHPNEALIQDYAKLHFLLTNSERKMFGQNSLAYQNKLAKVAELHATDMAQHQYFNHINKDGESPFDRMNNGGVDYRLAGENIAYGQVSPIEAHHGLMNSSGHRKNILKRGYQNMGVGIAFNDQNQPYYVENYITE